VADYCPTSFMPIDLLISEMLGAGLTTTDLKNLEKLSDPAILRRLPAEKRFLKHNLRDDVVLYLSEWARMLEEQWLERVELPAMEVEVI